MKFEINFLSLYKLSVYCVISPKEIVFTKPSLVFTLVPYNENGLESM
jgi:hypothetical protein